MNKKKIIFSINGSLKHCGVDEYTILLEKVLQEEYEFIHIVQSGSDIHKLLVEKGKKVLPLDSPYLKSIKQIFCYIKEYEPDIVFINTAKQYYLSILFPRYCKLIIVRHNSYNLQYFPNLFFLKRVNFIIAPSNFCASVIKKQFPKLKDKIKVIYNTVYLDNINYNDNSLSSPKNAKSDNFETDLFNIGFIGRIEPKKGILLLIDALYKMKKENLKFHCYIAGKFSSIAFEKEVKNSISQKGLERYITFDGFIKDKNEFYSKLDLVVIPSLKEVKETFGLVVLEAFLFNKPVVATSSGALPEIITYGPSSIVCHTQNPQDLANCIKLSMDKKLRDEYRYRMMIPYKSFFNFTKFKKDINDIIELIKA